MASKFLPFITEKTPLSDVFKALIKRSKGVSEKKITSIYSAIIKLGLETVRQEADRLLKTEPNTNVFTLLSNSYANHDVTKYEHSFWRYVLLNYGPEKVQNHDLTKEFQNMMFVCVACKAYERLNEIGFELPPEILVEYSIKDLDPSKEHLHPIKITSEGKRIGFGEEEELKAFIAFYKTNSNEVLEIYPVYTDTIVHDTAITQQYRQFNCSQPY